jgi:hypothetical protein
MLKKYVILVCFLVSGMWFSLCAQTAAPLRYDSIRYDENLSNLLFSKSDTLRDSTYLEGNMGEFFNVPICSTVRTSGDCDTASLLFCTCRSHHDTLFVTITGPSVCCYNELTIKIAQGKFNSSFLFSIDFSPADVHLNPVVQKLILKSNVTGYGEELQGYVYFEGKGKFGESNFDEDFSKEVKKAIFSAVVQGFFKCEIEKD